MSVLRVAAAAAVFTSGALVVSDDAPAIDVPVVVSDPPSVGPSLGVVIPGGVAQRRHPNPPGARARPRKTPRPVPHGSWYLIPRPGDPTPAEKARLRWCESGRDHSAGVDSRERATGLYKFLPRTWAGVGGHGDPAAASFAEQDYRMVLLFRREGFTPWRASVDCTGLTRSAA